MQVIELRVSFSESLKCSCDLLKEIQNAVLFMVLNLMSMLVLFPYMCRGFGKYLCFSLCFDSCPLLLIC